MMQENNVNVGFCEYCGTGFRRKGTGRPRKFCSDKCKTRVVYHNHREKHLARQKKYHEENRDKDNTRLVNKRAANKAKAVRYLGGLCIACDASYPHYVFDFHHVNPEEKEWSMTKLLSYDWGKIKEELDKCVLLCANCHREVHHGE